MLWTATIAPRPGCRTARGIMTAHGRDVESRVVRCQSGQKIDDASGVRRNPVGRIRPARHNAAMEPKKRRGRQPDPSSKSAQVHDLLQAGMSVADIVKKVGCKRGLVYVVKSRMAATAPKRGPGRPRKVAAPTTGSSLAGLDGIIAAVTGAQTQRAKMRAALEKVATIVKGALS